MNPEEAAALLAELKRGPKPAPMATDKLAKHMSEAERAAFLQECKRRFG